MKAKSKLLLVLFLIDQRKEYIQNNKSNNVFNDYSSGISEVGDSKDIKDRRDKLGILYYKTLTWPLKWYSVLWKDSL